MSQRIGITEEGKLVIYTDNAKIDGDDITSNIAGDFNITAENVQRLRGKSYSKYQQLNFFTSENCMPDISPLNVLIIYLFFTNL